MKLTVDVKIDPFELAREMDHSEAKDAILAIDSCVADYDFTLDVLRALVEDMIASSEQENLSRFVAIATLLEQVK